MKDFLAKNFQFLVIVGLVLYIYSKGIFAPSPQTPQPTVVRDTVYQSFTGSLPAYQPPIYISQPPASIPPAYKPDTSYMALLRQYQAVLSELLATNVVRDTIRLDSVGYVAITDSISHNRIASRQTSYRYRIPIITNTVTIPPQPRGHLYVLGGIGANSSLTIGSISTGLMYKTKRDQLYGIKASWSPIYGSQYEALFGLKIRLKSP